MYRKLKNFQSLFFKSLSPKVRLFWHFQLHKENATNAGLVLVASISAFQADGASSSLVSCSIPFNGIVHIILRAVQQIFY